MKKIVFFITVITTIIVFSSCKEVDVKPAIPLKTKLLFYTNAHELVNCGPWDVEVYVDSTYQGKLNYSLVSDNDSHIDCDTKTGNDPDGGWLLVTIDDAPPDTIKYYAKPAKCLPNNVEGEIAIKPGECHKIFLDFWGEVDYEENLKFLDTIFSEKNELIPDHRSVRDSNIYVINSLEELNALNPFGYKVDIDWSQYTLIAGRVTTWIGWNNRSSEDVQVKLEERNNDYLLGIVIDQSQGGYTVDDDAYFWRLYPKLKNDKHVFVEITRILY